MKKRYVGIVLILLAAILVGGYQLFKSQQKEPVSVTGLIGGEKIGLVDDPVFKKYIKDKHNLTFDYKKAGSIEMVSEETKDVDYLFPSSQVALDLYKKNHFKSTRDEIIFNTPIVIYSWKDVVKNLDDNKISYEKNGVHYIKMDKLSELMANNKTWKDLNNDILYGKIVVDTTDPNKSNSGNMFLGLVANALNKNEVVTNANIKNIEAPIKNIYQSIGYMQTSSSDIFKQYLTQGKGAFPLVAGYENQILEFSKNNTSIYDKVKNDIVILYPEPTVWSSHVFISKNEKTDAVIDILMEPEVQKIAWENHGFRTSNAKVQSSTVPGIASEVTKIMPMPSSDTMIQLMKIIK